MPEFTVVLFALIATMIVIGVVVGWVLRGNRAKQEKAAINASWQEQIDTQRQEHDRLTGQNIGLMEQNSQLQASNRDAKNRAKELSVAVQEAFARRDELQREIKDIRANLETSLSEREHLQSRFTSQSTESRYSKEKDARIAKLQSELNNWQDRVPPLIERFRVRNAEAALLESDLASARQRIAELEDQADQSSTRVDPVRDPDLLTDGRDASNDTIESQALQETAVVDDAGAADDANSQYESYNNAPNDARDDLQRIKGVGPAIEKTLHELGIFRFQQIAEMTEYDIDRVASRLRGFRSRIYREDWVGQARELRNRNATY